MDWTVLKDTPSSIIIAGLLIMFVKYFIKRSEQDRLEFKQELKEERNKFIVELKDARNAFTSALKELLKEKDEDHIRTQNIEKKIDKIYEKINEK